MLNRIEVSPSGRAGCKMCGRKIGIGTPRGVISTPNQSYGSSNSYVCYKCAKEKIKNDILLLIIRKKELEKMVKKQNKEIIVMELEDGNK